MSDAIGGDIPRGSAKMHAQLGCEWHIRNVKDARSIVLIGFMGAGKSSVGRCLQRLTGLARTDLDELVVSKFQLSIAEIFSKYGEERFRDAETELLRELSP